jgi:uncharacterized membrane protein
MSFEDWIFALHVLGAATLVGGLVMSWIVVVAFRSVDDARATLSLHRVSMVASAAVVAGLVLAIGFGIWLAILRVAFHPWDGWVVAAIVLWCVATALIVRSFVEYAKPVKKARALIAAGERCERRAESVEPDVDWALAARCGVGGDRGHCHRHDL